MNSAALLPALVNEITSCELCPRLRQHCRAVSSRRKREFAAEEYWGRPVPGFGDLDARFLIVGLAPAAHGGNRTGRVFTGDSSGDWLYDALHRYGWANQPVSRSRLDGLELHDCYITASARCAPPDNRPSRIELETCRGFLRREMQMLKATQVVLALGRIAWESWLRAADWWEELGPGGRPRFAHGEVTVLPDGMTLISSFHPSRQNTQTGRLTRKMWQDVFERARAIVPSDHPPLASPSAPPESQSKHPRPR
jgi:uracil-DNA glycosylase